MPARDKGATAVESLQILTLGFMSWDLGNMVPGVLDGKRGKIAFPAYLVTLSDGRRVLIDCGPDVRYISDPWFNLPPDSPIREAMPLELKPEDSIVNRLRQLDLSPTNVDALVVTHTHFDHAGNVSLFPECEIFVHRDAYEVRGPELPATDASGKRLQYHVINGDHEVAPGLALLQTPGHAPGHLSVLLHLRETGPVILAIDAIYSKVNRDHANYRVGQDPVLGAQSAQRLIELEQELGALLIYGHDWVQWEQLRKVPEGYT